MKPYFLTKSEQYENDLKLEMKMRMETLGLLAESFVTVGVAFPLFLVIILAIFAIVNADSQFILNLLWVVICGMIPMTQGGFVFALSMVSDVDKE